MHYYEVWVADGRFHGSTPLTYSSTELLNPLTVVSVPLRNALATGFILDEVSKPAFGVKPVKAALSQQPLPFHCLEMAQWLKDYYLCTYGEALRQFAPSMPSVRRTLRPETAKVQADMGFNDALTDEQKTALAEISGHSSNTVLLHGDTGSGKTRVYLELAKQTLERGKSVIILTPEIALTAQLRKVAGDFLNSKIFVLHSELSQSERKKVWFEILEAKEPVTIIGPRSALFSPAGSLGLIVVDEAHEPAYKQEQSPKYDAVRAASQLGLITNSRVVLGSATPSIDDYYLASQHQAVVRMRLQAKSGKKANVSAEIIDLKDKTNFGSNKLLSNKLIGALRHNTVGGGQSLVYFNRRGSARLILCDNCGWQFLCPNCDVPVVYHADEHQVRCHICGYQSKPPQNCPNCHNPDIVYTSIGTKTLVQMVEKLVPTARVQRFDSDNVSGERLNETYDKLHGGAVDILVGTQLVAKGLDLPKLNLVGIVSAETSLTLPDYTAEERTFQLLYQVIGRVGRHGIGSVIIQSFDPDSTVIKAAVARDYEAFYRQVIKERQTYRFPPFSYLLKLVCRRATEKGALNAAVKLRRLLVDQSLPVEVIGPTPSFYGRRGRYYYYQLVVKAKDRKQLVQLAALVPSGWSIDLDPADLL